MNAIVQTDNLIVEPDPGVVYTAQKPQEAGGGYMGGSVIQDKRSGKWCISVYWEGKRYRIYRHPVTRESFFSEKAARKQLSKIQTEIDEQHTFNPKDWFPDSPLLIRLYAHDWLKTANVSQKTLIGYKTAVNKYIAVFFKDKDIRNVRYNDLVKFKTWLSEKQGLSDKGVYNTIGVLKKMLRDAWRNEDIPKVPPFPKLSYEKPEIIYLTREQQETILGAIPETHRPIFQFMMEYGVRPQEARALQKDCIVNGTITIRRVFSENTLREGTKTGEKGVGVFGMTSYIKKVFSAMPDRKIESQFVFTRTDGRPYTSKDLNRLWHEAEEKAGIRIKLYNGIRHSLGCQLLDEGVSMDIVQDIYRHTKAEMTRRYAKRSAARITDVLENRRKIVEFRKKDEG